jgi:plastocyanin
MQRSTLFVVGAALAVGIAGYLLLRARQGEAPHAPVERSEPKAPGSPAGGSARDGAVARSGMAVIEGEVQFSGAPPSPGKLHREADPYCARTQILDPTVMAANGKLANVWVHVVTGAPDALPPAAPVELDQRDCMYTPRVTTAVVGQKVLVRNGDPVLHNVHAYLGSSSLYNRGMPNEKAAPIEYVAVAPGVMTLKCDVHPWMRGYVGVSPNAFQAVTGSDGMFRIPNLRPGRYMLAAWHEKFGVKALQVTAPARVIFAYDGSEQ